MEFAVRLCFLLGISETIATKSHQHNYPNKEDANEHAKNGWRKAHEVSTLHKEI